MQENGCSQIRAVVHESEQQLRHDCYALHIGVDFVEQPGRPPPKKNRETPIHLPIFTTFCPPQTFGFAHPIRLISLRQCMRTC